MYTWLHIKAQEGTKLIGAKVREQYFRKEKKTTEGQNNMKRIL